MMGYLKDAMQKKAQKGAEIKPAVATTPVAQRLGLPEPISKGSPSAAVQPPPLPVTAQPDEDRSTTPPKPKSAAPRAVLPALGVPAVPPAIPAAPKEKTDDDREADILANVDPNDSIVTGPLFPEDPLMGTDPLATVELAGPGSAFASALAGTSQVPKAAEAVSVPIAPSMPPVATGLDAFFDAAPATAPGSDVATPTATSTRRFEKTVAFQHRGDKGDLCHYEVTYLGPHSISIQKFRLRGAGIDGQFELGVGDVKTFKAGENKITITGKKSTASAQKEVHMVVELPEKAKKQKVEKVKVPEATKVPKETKEKTPLRLKEYVHEITACVCTVAVATAAFVAPGVSGALGDAFVPFVVGMYAVPLGFVAVSYLRRRKEVKEEMKNTDKVV